MPTYSPKLISRFPTYFLESDISKAIDLEAMCLDVKLFVEKLPIYTTYYIKGDEYKEFLKLAGMEKLKEIIRAHAIQYGKKVNIMVREDESVTLWANVYKPHDQHEYHNHPNVLMAGSFYLYTDEDSAEIIFQDPAYPMRMYKKIIDVEADHRYLEGRPAHYNTWEVNPKKGTLMLWPPYIQHRVRQQKKGERITISFNVG